MRSPIVALAVLALLCCSGMPATLAETSMFDALRPVWQAQAGGSATGAYVFFDDVAADSSGNVYAVGQYKGTVDVSGRVHTSATNGSTFDIIIAKYDPAGRLLWDHVVPGAAGDDRATGVGVDENGNAYVVGFFVGSVTFGGPNLVSAGNTDIFLVKYAANGSLRWSKRFGGTGHDQAFGLAVDSVGSVYITGYFGWFGSGRCNFGGGDLVTAGGRDVFLAKYSSTGTYEWAKRYGGAGDDIGEAVAVGPSGYVTTVGEFTGSASFGGPVKTSKGARDIFLLWTTRGGSRVFDKTFGGTGEDFAYDVDYSDAGVAIVGTFSPSIDFGGGTMTAVGGSSNAYVAVFSGSLSYVWARRLGTGPEIAAKAVEFDDGDDVVLGGSSAYAVDFGGGTQFTNGSYQAFLARYTVSGGYQMGKFYGEFYEETVAALAPGASRAMYAVGSFKAGIDFGLRPMTSSGGDDSFVLKMAP